MGIESCMEKLYNLTAAISSHGTSYGGSKFPQKLRISFGGALVTFYLLKQSSCKEESKFLLIVPSVTKKWSRGHIYFWIVSFLSQYGTILYFLYIFLRLVLKVGFHKLLI
nr:hypothetical protein Iba_chr05dCG13840 [Ipomoea batatas]GMD43284.1 hypothetical protein Iba_chr10cCG3780 [Ipomoea batatas]GMD80472.1 hypothetical protein Iba_chr13eCG2200 [Ipomoea batatas]GME12813.1 hypothetical protein Iba_scaffold14164CG0030 [Ipomoea batatas]